MAIIQAPDGTFIEVPDDLLAGAGIPQLEIGGVSPASAYPGMPAEPPITADMVPPEAPTAVAAAQEEQSQGDDGEPETTMDAMNGPGLANWALRHKAKALDDLAEIEKDEYDKQSRVNRKQAIFLNDEYKAQVARQDEHDTEYKTAHDKIMATMDDIANSPIDPKRYFHENAGKELVAAAGAFLDGLLAPNYGGRNFMLDHIDRVIDRDIQAQESDRSSRMDAAKAQANLLDMEMRRWNDSELARKAARLDKLAAFKSMLDSKAATLKSRTARANAESNMADFTAKLAKEANDFANDAARVQIERRRAAAGGDSPVDELKKWVGIITALDTNNRNDRAEERRKMVADFQVENVRRSLSLQDPWTRESLGVANDKTEAREINQKLAAAKSTTDRLQELIRETEELSRIRGPGIAMSQLWVGAKSKYGLLIKDYLNEVSGKVVTDREVEFTMNNILLPPPAFLSADPSAAWDNFRSFLLSKIRDRLATQRDAKQLPPIPAETETQLEKSGKLRD